MQKNQAISSICFGDIVDLNILQFDWLGAFWSKSLEQVFPNIGFVLKNSKNVNFNYRTNLVKIND